MEIEVIIEAGMAQTDITPRTTVPVGMGMAPGTNTTAIVNSQDGAPNNICNFGAEELYFSTSLGLEFA
jgi:hypothetical protein